MCYNKYIQAIFKHLAILTQEQYLILQSGDFLYCKTLLIKEILEVTLDVFLTNKHPSINEHSFTEVINHWLVKLLSVPD